MVGPCLHGDGSPLLSGFCLQLGTGNKFGATHPWAVVVPGVCRIEKWRPPLLSFEVFD
jgi:hypothetical protein